jgi:hypothetical protein
MREKVKKSLYRFKGREMKDEKYGNEFAHVSKRTVMKKARA